jgi:hypothetical protein
LRVSPRDRIVNSKISNTNTHLMRKRSTQNTRIYILSIRDEEVNVAEQTGEGGGRANIWSRVHFSEGMEILLGKGGLRYR